MSTGTGFLVNTAGWVLTTDHVVEEWCEVVTLPDGTAGRVVARDSHNDLALVRFPSLGGTEPLAFRNTEPRLVEDVVALGYPLSDVLAGGVDSA
jgi:S1-C subfamily serine protease